MPLRLLLLVGAKGGNFSSFAWFKCVTNPVYFPFGGWVLWSGRYDRFRAPPLISRGILLRNYNTRRDEQSAGPVLRPTFAQNACKEGGCVSVRSLHR